MSKRVISTEGFEQTQNLGQEFAKRLTGGEILALYGNLGSGKTTFVQGLARGLGITQKIISPTFIIVRKYEVSNQKLQIANFYHIDLYRVESENDIKGLGLEEILKDKSNVVAIEWPEKISKILPKNKIDFNFDYLLENKRKIEIIHN